MRIKLFLMACLLLSLTNRALAQTEITLFEEIFKDIPLIKPIKTLKTLTPEDKKEFRLQSLDEIMDERHELFSSYPRLEYEGLKSRPGASVSLVAAPGIEAVVGYNPEIYGDKGRVLSKKSNRILLPTYKYSVGVAKWA